MGEFAYEDSPLPIAEGQTISQPYIVALMIEAAGVKPGERVLDVGTGSGYAAAVLSRIAESAYSIERHRLLADEAVRKFARVGYSNIEVRCGDGTLGWPEAAPFDAILVAAGGPEVPEALRNQLKIGGRMGVSGAQAPDVLVQALRRAWQAAMPIEPARAGPRSDRMSPNRFEPTTTSNQSGCCTKWAHRISMWYWSVLMPG